MLALLASLFSRVLGRPDWLLLWDHLVHMEPVFLLYALAAFVHLHQAVLLDAASPQQVEAVLLRPSAVQMRTWLAAAHAYYERTPGDERPRWAPFRPLPPGDVYPPGLPHPTVLVDHGRAQVQQRMRPSKRPWL